MVFDSSGASLWNCNHSHCRLLLLINTPFALALLCIYAQCMNLIIGFGVITSDHVEDGFRQVDRKFFVPRVRQHVQISHFLHYWCSSFICIVREMNLSPILISHWSMATFTYLLRIYMDLPSRLWISSQIPPCRFWTSGVELGIYLALLLRFLDPTLSTTVRIT